MAAAQLSIAPFLNKVNQFILNPLIGLLFAVALCIFIYGIVLFIKDSNDSTAREKGRRSILYGLVGMFIMFSAYGIVRVILNTFDLNTPPYIDKKL
ncbi:MAG: seg [Parcubacteria group bacterium]|nr:seg [Parcubacteria group bacterium]